MLAQGGASARALSHTLRFQFGNGLFALAVAMLAGCVPDAEPSPESRSAARRDSAGIRIVESAAPAWDAVGGWRLASIPEVVIGAPSNPLEGRDEIPLYRVQGARFLPDGGIHRLGSHACAFAGLLIVASGFLPHPARLWASALVFLAMVMVPVAYSYVIWRDLGEDRLG